MKKLLFVLVASIFLLASCGGSETVKAPTDIINPDAEYRYFFGASCPHCQELNRIAESKDLYSKISIEKREVYNNPENRDMFITLIEELETDKDGVPFVYDTVTGEVAVGVEPALRLMTSRLGNKQAPAEENTTTETITGTGETQNSASGTTATGSQQ